MKIAIVGATGLVGRTVLQILEEFNLINGNQIFLYASKRSAGAKIDIAGMSFEVKELNLENLEGVYDIAIFSAGSAVAKGWANEFVMRGAYVIDNSSAFRRMIDVPLVVPEINFDDINNSTKIIANPNCSTIGVSLPLHEMSKLYKIKRVIVSTYQAVSGAGQTALFDMQNGTTNKLSYKITNNLIPQIDSPLESGYTFEEDKMEFELKKILNDKDMRISTTCVRVPVANCHSESVNIEFETGPDIEKIKKLLSNAEGICLYDDLNKGIYPMPIVASGKNDVFVGRIRRDTSNKNAINIFISFDNIRKGAALNAVQIAKLLIENNFKL